MASSSPSSSSVCFHHSDRKHIGKANTPKPVVNIWLEAIREQLDIERKVDINHYQYVKLLREEEISFDDCQFYSACESYDRSVHQRSKQHVNLQEGRDSLLIRDLERKLRAFSATILVGQLSSQVIHVGENFQSPNNDFTSNFDENVKPLNPVEPLYSSNEKKRCVSLDDEQYNELFSPNDILTTNDSIVMASESLKEPPFEDTSTNELNKTEQCIGQVVVRMNELGNSNNRLSLNLLFDKNFLDLCKHISSVSTKTNKVITPLDKAQLTSATSIELTIPIQQSGDIDIDISLDHTESSCESRNSNYESAVDLEDKVASSDMTETNAFDEVTMRNKTWVKYPRAKSLVEASKDVMSDEKKINKTSLLEYSNCSPFFFPSSTLVRRRDEESESVLCLTESTPLQQTVGLPEFDEHGQNFTSTPNPESENLEDGQSLPGSADDSSLGSPSTDMASYESFTATDSTYHSDYNTLDSRMMDFTSHTFETLLYIPRASYNQVEDSLSDVTCSHFSSMENIAKNLFNKRETGDLNIEGVDDVVSVSSDIAQWMRDIFNNALDDEDEDWKHEWFSSNDLEGRMYFFEENSSESSWTLPEVINPTNADGSSIAHSVSQDLDSNISPTRHKPPTGDRQLRNAKAKSMILIDPSKKPTVAEPPPLTPLSKHWPQLWDGHMCVLREGTLARTKITEHGKRLKKNWATSHVVLTELFLLFFKDAKQFHTMKTGGCVGRPELTVDLNGAIIDRGDKMSSRRNVFLISTVLTLQVLVQFESSTHADSWLLAIHNAIKNLPSGVDNCSRIFKNPSITNSPDSSDNKKSKICRSKSVKLKKEGSIEDLPASSAERQTKIKARLKKFFNRRPTMDHLVKKGIYKDEPAFGCYLEKVCPSEVPRVPLFVQRCVQCIEKSEENMKTDGLYRASGNLSQVQKIRLQVDQNNLTVLDEEEDVHVLAGALKLFFRELKEPLIPYHAFNKALKASSNHNRKEKLQLFRDIIRSLPSPNHDTFKFLLQHLLRVTKYKEFNRMHIPNLAIVFGPTLMWSEQESKNMALDFMQQNLVIECFLVEFEYVFR